MGTSKIELEKQRQERIGEVGYNNDGEQMTIIEYNKYTDITVQFKDGSIVKSRLYGDFKKGKIKKPENRLGEVNYNKQGERMTIVEYFSATNISVQFENGYIAKNKDYFSFKNGHIKNLEARIGEIGYNNFGSKMIIIEYKDANNMKVQFQDEYRYITSATYQSFEDGEVRNPYDKSVFNHGYIGEGEYKPSSNRRDTREYGVWKAILQRCYDPKWHEKYPSYKGCTISEEWLNFQNFARFYHENYYEIKGERIEIDKDILIKNNKVYSAETCLFVPQRINILFIRNDARRGDLPIGVSLRKDSGRFMLTHNSNQNHGKNTFDTPEETFKIYKDCKEKTIKQIANEYKDKIPQKLYDAMTNWKVEITD